MGTADFDCALLLARFGFAFVSAKGRITGRTIGLLPILIDEGSMEAGVCSALKEIISVATPKFCRATRKAARALRCEDRGGWR